MPRTVIPIPVLRIESLSTGPVLDLITAMTDDFTGEIITPVVQPQANAKAPQSAQEITDAAKHEQSRINQLLLQAAGILPKAERTRAKNPASVTERTSAQTPIPRKRSFTKIVLVRQPKDWRRI
jgi:hypothetical protein